MEVTNNKEGNPLAVYLARYQTGNPAEMASRCALPWDGHAFTMHLLGQQYLVTHPDFTLDVPASGQERILFLRYLLDGRAAAPTGKFLAYQEFPWGEVYLQQFTGRCIRRYAFSYGAKPDLLNRIMEQMPAKKISRSDCGWQVELMPGLEIQFLLWLGDDEFPPNAQILFSDNFQSAFTAEDLANIGDIVMNRMKQTGTSR
ncbi:MAG: DUF3786 domain-containing protein [Oscillospiraceae bacterium]|nr:DUF3786 domain-containing protein [Oscillospiraceae bacterium]